MPGSNPNTARPPFSRTPGQPLYPAFRNERGIFTPDFHLSLCESRRLSYLYETSALYHNPVSDCVQRRPTFFPGQDLPDYLWMTGPEYVRDSSSTGGVCCVSGRISAFCDLMSALHHAPGLTFSSASFTLLVKAGHPERYPFRTSHRSGMSRQPERLFFTGLQKMLNQKRTLPDCPARFHDTDQDFRFFSQ